MRHTIPSRSAPTANVFGSVAASARQRRPIWLGIVGAVVWIWRKTRWLWVAVASIAALGVIADVLAPTASWAPINWLRSQPGIAGAVLAVSSLALACGLAASLLAQAVERDALAPYGLRRANLLAARDYVAGYVGSVYVPRHDETRSVDLDAFAVRAVQTAAQRRPLLKADSPLGICVFGRPGDGKTRLAWEVLQAVLPRWTVLRWPHRPLPELTQQALGRRVVLWLDDAHEFTHPNDAVILNDLPRRCAEAGIRLVVIATCGEGAAETQACRQLGSLMERLTPVRLAPLSRQDADMLALALAKQEVQVRREDFTGTPASLVFALPRMRAETYPALPKDARRVLAAVKLLRSAGVYDYSVGRVRLVSIEVFDLAPAAFGAACSALLRAGVLRSGGVNQNGEQLLIPVSRAMLDTAIPGYLTRNGEESEDWPWLQEALGRGHDAEGLLCLGNALSELRTGGGPFLPYDPRVSKQLAVTCLRTALELTTRNRRPYDWAITQANLGLALYRQAELATAYLRDDLQRQSAAAYRAALEIITRETHRAEWAMVQLSIASVFKARAKDAVYSGNVDGACAALRDAWRYVENALTVYTLDTDPARYRQTLQAREGILDAMRELGCVPGDPDEFAC